MPRTSNRSASASSAAARGPNRAIASSRRRPTSSSGIFGSGEGGVGGGQVRADGGVLDEARQRGQHLGAADELEEQGLLAVQRRSRHGLAEPLRGGGGGGVEAGGLGGEPA